LLNLKVLLLYIHKTKLLPAYAGRSFVKKK